MRRSDSGNHELGADGSEPEPTLRLGPAENCRKFQRAVHLKAWRKTTMPWLRCGRAWLASFYFTWRHNGVSVCQAPGTTRPHFAPTRRQSSSEQQGFSAKGRV